MIYFFFFSFRYEETNVVLTWEGDVETLVGNGEVGEKADLSRVVPKQACAERRGQRGARQSPQRLRETPIFCHQQMIMRALQVKRVEGELNTCRSGRKMACHYLRFKVNRKRFLISERVEGRPFNERLTNKAAAPNWRNCTLNGDVCEEASCGACSPEPNCQRSSLQETAGLTWSKRPLGNREWRGGDGGAAAGHNSVREIEFDCCMCWHRGPLLTFAVRGLDYPGAVQVVGVKVRESRWQDGAGAPVDVTSAKRCRARGETFGDEKKKGQRKRTKDKSHWLTTW